MSSATRVAADRIHSAAIHLMRRVTRVDTASGTSAARLSALSVLVFLGPRTISELAAIERVRVPTMSKLITGMEEERLVRRAAHEDDARSVVVHATVKGRRLLDRARELRLTLLESLLENATAREIAVVREAADIIDRLVL